MISHTTLKNRLLISRLIIFHSDPHVVLLIINRSEIGGKIIGTAGGPVLVGRPGCQPVLLRNSFSAKRAIFRCWRVPAAEPQSLQQDPDIVIKGIHRAVKVLELVILNLGMVDPDFAQLEQEILIS